MPNSSIPFEAQVLAAFFISILLNGLLLFGLGLLELRFEKMSFLLPIISAVLILITARRFYVHGWRESLGFEVNGLRIGIYSFVFVILFYNGGLIELLADSWWHMSLASKIAAHSNLFLDFGHLNGFSQRYYPPLWHGNLALAHIVSGEAMVILWNSFTAWGGVLKVMGFYLFALALGRNKGIAVLSAILFILLPGMGDSYLRVSAWPSHIAYAALFSVFYIGFTLFSSSKLIKALATSSQFPFRSFFEERAKVVCAAMLLLVIYYSHQAELVWLLLALLFYWTGLSIMGVFNISMVERCEPALSYIRPIGIILILAALSVALWFFLDSWASIKPQKDLIISYGLPVLMLGTLLYMQVGLTRTSSGLTSKANSHPLMVCFLIFIGCVLLFSIDLKHLLSLFDPSMAYPKGRSHESSLMAPGWFGGGLAIPGWHLQLRGGLLYSGVISLPLSIILAIYRPSRLTLFLASTGIFAFMFCSSPYLYHWLKNILNYHSPWRIGIIIFHPIVIATALHMAWTTILSTRVPQNG